MQFNTLDELKSAVSKEGFLHKAILSDADYAKADALLRAHPDVIDTPSGELRYIEGLLELPYGFINEFKVVPAPQYKKCNCGRTPSALEVISYAGRRNVHSKSTIRDTLIGFHNVYEPSNGAREADCIVCGRRVQILMYFRHGYPYA